ncbi:hypothetical protein [Denitromonas halophila]|uniref:Phage tail assembly protein n=1 Tax=Denitromonas halophila TaxID=1629404 RepID=A0A557QX97_9RHOO|nr:hypothetical protein [Denitromonas halophila]TVO57523.1 hypothetical protein FHP91_07550 [Denitromonas halophila]
MITVEGKFVHGVPMGKGVKRATDFTLRAGTVRDSVEALEECGPDASPSRLRYATLARRLTVSGVEQITTDVVMDLTDRDGVVLENTSDELEKKLDDLKID